MWRDAFHETACALSAAMARSIQNEPELQLWVKVKERLSVHSARFSQQNKNSELFVITGHFSIMESLTSFICNPNYGTDATVW